MPKQRRFLYLVLDDWSWGYCIRKVALSSGGDHGYPGEQALPSPIFRFEAQRGLPMYFAAAFDSKIITMQPVSTAADGVVSYVPKNFIPVIDVHVRSLRYAPRPKPDHVDPIYIPVDGRHFALAAGSFELLCYPPAPEPDGSVWSWWRLLQPPFEPKYATSYALHPDGRTIFVSVEKLGSPATFTFNTADRALEDGVESTWEPHGPWLLPFAGRAYFEPELDAWVGLSRDDRGRLCSCDVVPAAISDDSSEQCPARKLSKEKFFSEDSVEKHVGANLVYMGGRSKLCLVQSFCIEGASAEEINHDSVNDMDVCKMEEQNPVSRPRRYWIRLTTFFLNYDKSGDLTTGNSRRAQCYKAPKTATESMLKYPVAFWM